MSDATRGSRLSLRARQLVVNDGLTAVQADLVLVTTRNSPPVVNAGPDQTAAVTGLVTLDGSASSDVDGDPLAFSWTLVQKPPSSAAVLNEPNAIRPTLVIDAPGAYVVSLVVNDGAAISAPDTATISTVNSTPVADAGADGTARVGDVVALDGSGSTDVDGDALTYAWALISTPAGSSARLSDPVAVRPTFVVDRAGVYVAQLIVSDDFGPGTPATVTITTENSAPIARAGRIRRSSRVSRSSSTGASLPMPTGIR